jgi:predicted  nucleic acid-binding Zn-ribbon protein
MPTTEDRVTSLEQESAVMKEHIQGSLEAINEKLQMLLDGKGGNCILQNSRISRLEEYFARLSETFDTQLKKREEQLALKADKTALEKLDSSLTWVWRTFFVTGLGLVVTLFVEYMRNK